MTLQANLERLEQDLIPVIKEVQAQILSDCRAFEEDEIPGIQITVGTTMKADAWDYQTGDNSYSGNAYFFPVWGIAGVYEDSDPREKAQEICEDILNQIPED